MNKSYFIFNKSIKEQKSKEGRKSYLLTLFYKPATGLSNIFCVTIAKIFQPLLTRSHEKMELKKNAYEIVN